MKKIETEYKLELTKEEFNRCNLLLKEKALFLMSSELKDYFFDVKKFDEKGYDFTRVRVYDNKKFEKTDKIWKLLNDQRIRVEKEEIISRGDLEKMLNSQPDFIYLEKQRTDYELGIKNLGLSAVISLDKLTLKNGAQRYFIETEIDVPEEMSNSIRTKLKGWMLEFFSLSDRPEGIGMFKLALSQIEEKSSL